MQYKKTADYLKRNGIRPSRQRVLIWNYLAGQRTHPTADQIYHALNDGMPELSKTTVYNSLRLFMEKGLVTSLKIDENENHFDAVTVFHAHFRCNECGEIADVELPPEVLAVEGMEAYEILERQFYLKGYCPRCKAAQQ